MHFDDAMCICKKKKKGDEKILAVDTEHPVRQKEKSAWMMIGLHDGGKAMGLTLK